MEFFITIQHGIPIAGRDPLFRYYSEDGEIWSSEDPTTVEEKLVELMKTNPTSILDVVSKTGVTFAAILGRQ